MKNGAIIAAAVGVGVPVLSAVIQPTWAEILASGVGSVATAVVILAYVYSVDEIDETDAWFWLAGAALGIAAVYAWKGPQAALKSGASVIASP